MDVHNLLKAIAELDLVALAAVVKVMPTLVPSALLALRLGFAPTHYRMVHQFGELLSLQLTSKLGLLGAIRVLDIAGHIDQAGATERERDNSVEEPMAEIGCHASDIALYLGLKVHHLLYRTEIRRIGHRIVRHFFVGGIFGLLSSSLPTDSFLEQTRHIE